MIDFDNVCDKHDCIKALRRIHKQLDTLIRRIDVVAQSMCVAEGMKIRQFAETLQIGQTAIKVELAAYDRKRARSNE